MISIVDTLAIVQLCEKSNLSKYDLCLFLDKSHCQPLIDYNFSNKHFIPLLIGILTELSSSEVERFHTESIPLMATVLCTSRLKQHLRRIFHPNKCRRKFCSSNNPTEPYPIPINSVVKSPLPCVYHSRYSVEPWPDSHRFRMPKFKGIYDNLHSNSFNFTQLKSPTLPNTDDILLCHSKDYLNELLEFDKETFKQINMVPSDWLIERSKLAINGTLDTCYLAIENGLGVHLAGGTHHAQYDNGSGFCLFNDMAFASLMLLENNNNNNINNCSVTNNKKTRIKVEKILILDLDVHQGDGTANIINEINYKNCSDCIFTVSVHCEKNFPFVKKKSYIDVSLNDNLNDNEYLDKIEKLLLYLLDENNDTNNVDLVIYDGGVDISMYDQLGRLNISDNGIYKRDKFVIESCLQREIPIACVIGGGYDKNDDVLAQRHSILHWTALEMWNKYKL